MPTKSPTSATEQVDRELAQRAIKKLSAGQTPTVQEQASLKRFEKEREEKLRWQYYSAIPQKHWREMSGRQTKVINEQAERYGIPFGGAFIDLPKVVRSLHDFLAKNKLKLATDDDLMQSDVSSPALERYREERAALAKLDRQERETQLLPRNEAKEAMGRAAAILRSGGDALQRQFGSAAVETLNEFLDDFQREIDR
jgi:hypothetical protein